jgi:hypothetical protein
LTPSRAAAATGADRTVCSFLASKVAALPENPRFADGLFAALRPDPDSQELAEAVVLPRLRAIGA